MDKEIYNSVFQNEIYDLIELKRALGFSYESEAGSLRRIDTFLCENHLSEKCITKELCELWCRKRTYETVTNQASRISIMRVFCRYLNDIGIPAYVPPKGINQSFELALWLPSYADVDAEYERLLKLGLNILSGEPITYDFGIRNFYVADPEGNLIEIGSMNK